MEGLSRDNGNSSLVTAGGVDVDWMELIGTGAGDGTLVVMTIVESRQ